ncbi:MAG TPA: S8 family serine peptidase [Candidatus Acidoferrales bacterium]|nr:S8 family serine peptidase [Candidatus Acidoferrales bacterium]
MNIRESGRKVAEAALQQTASHRIGLSLSLALLFVAPMGYAQSSARKQVSKESDLPRFTYPISGSASDLLQADPATFDKFAVRVRADVESTLRDYDIQDKATLRKLLKAKLDLEQLAGQNQAALQTLDLLRAAEEKPDARLITGLLTKAILQATIATGATNGPAFEQAFRKNYGDAIRPLPWGVVQSAVKQELGAAQILNKALLIATAKTKFDPGIEKTSYITAEHGWGLIGLRAIAQFQIPVEKARSEILESYIAENRTTKPDIWQAREVTFTGKEKLTPVLVGIWGEGVDVSVYPNQVFDDPQRTASGTHGLAFDDQGNPSRSWLYPLTPELQSRYAATLKRLAGGQDLQTGVDSPEARALKQMMASSSPEQLNAELSDSDVIGNFVHGTHVAGIAVRGNPASRIVVFRFNLPTHAFPPSIDRAKRLAADYQQISEYCRTRNVRVVNMSWSSTVAGFEDWLWSTKPHLDPEKRKSEAQAIYQIRRKAIEDAIRNAPGTLFVASAGNSNSNASFDQSFPAALHLPNLITVGAVDQAGDETTWTSYGDTVVVDADGYRVESFVPGGSRLRMWGTSMAAPQVANLAAKLFALDPSLTPEQAIKLIRDGATTSADGRRHLIDPKRTVELLQEKR